MTDLSELIERAENGPMRFPDDWAGVFIRGDSALHYAMLVREAVKATEQTPILSLQLNGLANLLQTCAEPCTTARHVALQSQDKDHE